jgi:hypothetical protein
LGVKYSYLLAVPAFAVVGTLNLPRKTKFHENVKKIVTATAALGLAIAVLAWPSGYNENLRVHHHPLGPQKVRAEHTFEGESFGAVLKYGTLNMLRFGMDFLSLDGLPLRPQTIALQRGIKWLPQHLLNACHINLEDTTDVRAPFRYIDRARSSSFWMDFGVPIWAHEDVSFFGILGILLVLPALLLALIGVLKSPGSRALAFGAVLFLAALSFSGRYDPYRGRHFMIMGMMACPIVAALFDNRRITLKAALLLTVTLGCISGLFAVFERRNYRPTDIPDRDRIAQLTRNSPESAIPLRAFEAHIPANATVAVFFPGTGAALEYPLFGKGLTRTIIPLNSYYRGQRPMPADADYFLYDAKSGHYTKGDTTFLGTDRYMRWYIARLK